MGGRHLPDFCASIRPRLSWCTFTKRRLLYIDEWQPRSWGPDLTVSRFSHQLTPGRAFGRLAYRVSPCSSSLLLARLQTRESFAARSLGTPAFARHWHAPHGYVCRSFTTAASIDTGDGEQRSDRLVEHSLRPQHTAIRRLDHYDQRATAPLSE
jgi:hypothetical protein